MATKQWLGGATLNTQQQDQTPAVVSIGSIFTLTARGEDGTEAAVNYTATTTTVAEVTAGLTAAWNTSTNDLHTPVTATDNTTDVILTADNAGIPFYVTPSTSGVGSPTLVESTITANSGPHDWNTAANWDTGTIPATTDDVLITTGSYSIFYGLEQDGNGDASAVDLHSLEVGPLYTGSIGQETNGYYLKLDCSDGTAAYLRINGRGDSYWFSGAFDETFINGCLNRANAVWLGGAIVGAIYISGQNVRGRINIGNEEMASTTGITMTDCPAATLLVGTHSSGTVDMDMTTGTATVRRDPAVMDIFGGSFVLDADGKDGGTINCWGPTARVEVRDIATLSTVRVYGGVCTLGSNRAPSITINGVGLYGGTLQESDLTNITYTNDIFIRGGKYIPSTQRTLVVS